MIRALLDDLPIGSVLFGLGVVLGWLLWGPYGLIRAGWTR